MVNAVQPARIASPRAMPGELEMSKMLVAARSAVASSPAIGESCEARTVTKTTTAGAKNGTTTNIDSAPENCNHQVGLPTVCAEIAKTTSEPAINKCVMTTATAQGFVSEPERKD